MESPTFRQFAKPQVLKLRQFVQLVLFASLFFTFLQASAQYPRLRLPIGHIKSVNTVAYSADFQKVLTASSDYTAKVWDANTGLLLLDLKGHTGDVKSAQFSHDGRSIVTASADNTAIIWDTQNGKPLRQTPVHGLGLRNACFSPDDKTILTIGIDNVVYLWNANTCEKLFGDTVGDVDTKAKFTPDGKKIIVFSGAPLTVIDAATGTVQQRFKTDTADNMLDFSPDGKMFATIGALGRLMVYDVATMSLKFSVKGHSAWENDVKFINNGQAIATASDAGFVELWNADTGASLGNLDNHARVNNLCLSGDKTLLFAIASGGEGLVWDLAAQKSIAKISADGDNDGISSVAAGQNRDFLVGYNSGLTQIRDVGSGKSKISFRGYSISPECADYSHNGKWIAIGYGDGNTRIWDAQTGVPLTTLSSTADVQNVAFCTDDSRLLAAIGDGTVNVWDTGSGKIIAQLYNDSLVKMTDMACMALFSRDGRTVYTAHMGDKVVKVWDVASGKVIRVLDQNTDNIRSLSLSPDFSKIVTSANDGKSLTWDAKTGAWLSLRSWPDNQVTFAHFAPDSRYVLAGMQNKIILFDPGIREVQGWKTGNPVLDATFSANGSSMVVRIDSQAPYLLRLADKKYFNLLGNTPPAATWVQQREDNNCLSAVFSNNSQELVTGWGDGSVKFFTATDGKLLRQAKEHDQGVFQSLFSPDSKRAFTLSDDHLVKLWDAASGEVITTSCVLGSSDYLIETPAGYYQCTQGAAKRLQFVTKDLKVLAFSQLDIKYNRPDKVLQVLGDRDTALISAYHQAYLKRMELLKIDTNAFSSELSVPFADFKNRLQIQYKQPQTLTVRLAAKDSLDILDRYNIWINDVPLYGADGISVRQQNTKSLDIQKTIKLSEGDNRIEMSVTNVNGIESYHIPLYVNFQPIAKAAAKVYFIGIGIDNFADAAYNLQWSVKDIRDLAAKMKSKFGADCTIDTLFDKNVTRTNISALKQKLLLSGIEDKVVIAYSGHGLFSKSYDYYLSSYQTNFNKPEQAAIPYQDLEGLLDNIPARKKLMLIDACNSGNIDQQAAEKAAAGQKANLDPAALLDNAKANLDDQEKNGGIGDQRFFELMQQLFVNVGRNTGATIISASAGTQFAHSEGTLKNGVFTFSTLEFLANDHCSIAALKAYVNKRVPELTNGQQSPTTRMEMDAADWNLW